jgi:chromosome segregation protein
MRLKQIKLIGFKSFVEPTILPLNAQLIGIVGPNGCGKSNVIDAIRWVLGENSTKDLRGESIVDVIFNGSSLRKPIGRASIELLFDNADGHLNREYANFSEVSIRREIDRDKQSDYYLNDKKCRKRDITDLFTGTGILQNGYAIISQGTVSKIIESRPEDLRTFIEEAADISIYKKRRHETELRMGHTQENLSRLQDILQEQARLVEKLEKQCMVAQKYQKYQNQKKDIETKLLSIKSYNFQKDLDYYDNKIKELSAELQEHSVKKSDIDLCLEQQKKNFSSKLNECSELKEQFYNLDNRIVKIEQSLKYKKEQADKYQEELKLIHLELTTILKQQDKDQLNKQEVLANLATIEESYVELQSKKSYAEKIYSDNRDKMQDLQNLLANAKLKLQSSQNKCEKIRISIEQTKNLAKELYSRIEKLNQENLSYGYSGLQKELLLLEEKLKTEETLLHTKHQELLIVNDSAQEKKRSIKILLNNKNDLQSNIHKIQGQISSIEILQKSSFELSTNKLNWLRDNNISGIELFFDKLFIEDGWELAVGVILNQFIDAWIAPKNINNFSTEAWQSVTDFKLALIENTLSKIEYNQSSNPHGFVSITDKVKSDLCLMELFANIYVAEDLFFAIENRNKLMSQEFFVTKKGAMVGSNWLIIDQADNKQKTFLRKKELKELSANLEDLNFKILALNDLIDVSEKELANIERNHTEIIESNKEQANIIRSLSSEFSGKKSKLEGIKIRTEKIVLELEECQQKLGELSNKEKILTEDLAKENMQMSVLVEQENTLEQEKQALQQNLEHLKEKSKYLNEQFHDASLKKQQFIVKQQSLDEAENRLTNQISKLKQKQYNLEIEIEKNNSLIDPLQKELCYLLDNKEVQRKRLTEEETLLNSIEDQKNELEDCNNNLIGTAEQCRSTLESFKLEQKSIATRLEDLFILAKENNITLLNLNVELNDGNNISGSKNLDITLFQENLDLIIKKINKLGAVNLSAIEELSTEKERKSSLELQIADLTNALETLKDAIVKIDLQTKQKFKTTFEQINDNFKELFPKLFGGGEAYLELNEKDVLSAGLSVFARPPGKKNSSIYLLSGGEKALTAVALIFAIFQLNPAPFCILDEVDAPLDDANVIRFGELLISMSYKVQFIFITHNKITMKAANQLIGVTMKEPGVSRLVSVNVEEALAMVN